MNTACFIFEPPSNFFKIPDLTLLYACMMVWPQMLLRPTADMEANSVQSVTCRKRNVFSSLHIVCMVFKEVNETGQQVHLREIVQCVQDVDSVVRGLWRAQQNTYYKSAILVLCLLISIIGQLLPT